MEKFVPFEKLSKKKQKELNKAKRNTWGLTDPVTKCSENKKIYNRKKLNSNRGYRILQEKYDIPDSCYMILIDVIC